VIVFSNTITPRLQYIFDFIGKEITGEPFQITTDAEIFRQHEGPKINYSRKRIAESEFIIHNSELLFERGFKEQSIECFEIKGYKAFLKAEGDFPFDIFGASFYLLSRYEEYLPHEKDMYGRYASENSLAFKENFLHVPLVNTWLQDFKRALQSKFPGLITYKSSFTFIPTYDIDEAFSYTHKQWWRTLGGMIKDITRGQWSVVNERIKSLLGKNRDPYDAFEWMHHINEKYELKPIYFFLVANRTARYDKNILPSNISMEALIQEHGNRYPIGIHPSWQSGDDPEKLKFETLKLGHISGKAIRTSRQHYIRFTLPQTYRQLISLGIESDFSMGYGSINGFRASVSSPFYWYDLQKELQTKLLLYPFCFMDSNSFYKQKFSGKEASEELKHYYEIVRSVNGTLVTIWHNNFLGTGKQFSGWKEIYEQFISSIKS